MAKREKIKRQRREKRAAKKRPSAASRKRTARDNNDAARNAASQPPPPTPLPVPSKPKKAPPPPPPPGFEHVTPTIDAEVFENLAPLQMIKPSKSAPLLVESVSGTEYMKAQIPDPVSSFPKMTIPKRTEPEEPPELPKEIDLYYSSDEEGPETPLEEGAFEDDDEEDQRYKMLFLDQDYIPLEVCKDEFLPVPVPSRIRRKLYGYFQHDGASESGSAAGDSSDLPSSPTVGAGITNQGMTCFMNAILQCLTHTVPFVHAIRTCNHTSPCSDYHTESSYCAICALRENIDASLQTPRRPVNPSRLVDKLSFFSPDFEKGKQGDAHEFMQAAFGKIKNCLLDEDGNPVDRVFGGKTVSMLRCCKCDDVSNTYEPVTDLSLEIEDVETVERALDSFTRKEIIDDEKVKCDKCEEQVSKEKRLLLHKTPQIAVFHLKRFKQDIISNIARKIDKHVYYSFDLNLQPYTSSNQENVILKYVLYAIVVHSGTPDSGHYYCYVRTDENNWHKLDDEKVTQVDEDEAQTQPAYLLFYAQQGTPWFVASFTGPENPEPKPEEENAAMDHAQEKADDGDLTDAYNENAAMDHTEEVCDDDPMDAYNDNLDSPDEEESTDEGSPNA